MYKGIIDGKYGPKTQVAVQSFQKSNGRRLTSGRVVGHNTLTDLNSAIAHVVKVGSHTGGQPVVSGEENAAIIWLGPYCLVPGVSGTGHTFGSSCWVGDVQYFEPLH